MARQRVVVIGAGIVGACTALAAAQAGCEVTVVDRGQPASGTTSRGEGNVLVSDKPPGPELDLALLSRRLWDDLAAQLGAHRLELEAKGGLVVAREPAAYDALVSLASAQTAAGVQTAPLTDPRSIEPHLAAGLAGGVHYPQDAQVQPVLATAAILAEAQRLGARLRPGCLVVTAQHARAGAITGITLDTGEQLPADTVVNAAGTWGGAVGALLGAPVPVLPRRGFVLVTEPLPPRTIRHKVYSADYVANVAASTEDLQTSCVVESTQAGPVLIGASRERVGFDATLDPAIVTRLARQAVELFPMLADVQLLRAYRGFRPYCPDHLPVIGPDPRVPGVLHACGHEGAGIGLAPATGALIAAYLTGDDPATLGLDPTPFLPDRLLSATIEEPTR